MELSTLNERELAQVVTLWKRTSRELVTTFTGTSMRPTIDSGSEVIVKCDCAVNIGDVVAYCLADRLIVHRVAAASLDGEWFVVRGDALVIPDAIVLPRQMIVGNIVAVKRNGTFCDLADAPRPRRLTSFVDAICGRLARNEFLRRHVLRRFLRVARLFHRLWATATTGLSG
ncbi:MAG: S24/S26 family peptidase [Acidobacteriota bacterium]|nr:S24/S26 family peptidase [Acidobacteriota bacterium]